MTVLMLVLRRVAGGLLVIVAASILVFLLVSAAPGDPARTALGESATPEAVDDLRARLGLDESLVVQFRTWATEALQGDLGTSLTSSIDVTTAISERIPVTLSLALGGLFVSALVGIPLGVLAAVRPNGAGSRIAHAVSALGLAVPSFWLALMLLLTFSLRISLFPPFGYVGPTESVTEWLAHLVLPSIALGMVGAAEVIRQTRTAMIDSLSSDYVRTARAGGATETDVVMNHALRNALIPVVTVLGLQVSLMFSGSVIIETIFGMPGLGQLAVRAVLEGDLRMVQGIVLVTTIVAILTNLVVDLLYTAINPRLRH